MFRTLSILSMACIAITSACAATDPFVGDWKLNPAKSKLSDQMKVNCVESNRCIFNLGPVPENIVLDGTDSPANSAPPSLSPSKHLTDGRSCGRRMAIS